MTPGDFILSILTSLAGAIGYDIGQKGLVFFRSKKFRKIRKRFVREVALDVRTYWQVILSHADMIVREFGSGTRMAFASYVRMLITAGILFYGWTNYFPQLHAGVSYEPKSITGESLNKIPVPRYGGKPRFEKRNGHDVTILKDEILSLPVDNSGHKFTIWLEHAISPLNQASK